MQQGYTKQKGTLVIEHENIRLFDKLLKEKI